MPIEIVEQPMSLLAEHATVPIAFQVERVLHIEERGDSLSFSERRVEHPYSKDYDTLESPLTWNHRFDLTAWGLLAAFLDDQRVAGAVIAFDTPDVGMLQGRRDLAVLWDLRVDPRFRRQGIGGALFRAAEDWAAFRGCVELRIETQNTNIAACRFYEGLGCELREVNPGVYPAHLDEVQLIWSRVPRAL